jgi:hypothetical protein
MPIRALLEGGVFSPEDVTVLVAAFEGACLELGVSNRDDIMAEVVAKAVVDVGRQSMTDAITMRNRALLLLRNGKLVAAKS